MVGGGAEARIANERPAGVWQNTEETEEQEVAHTDAEPPLHDCDDTDDRPNVDFTQ